MSKLISIGDWKKEGTAAAAATHAAPSPKSSSSSKAKRKGEKWVGGDIDFPPSSSSSSDDDEEEEAGPRTAPNKTPPPKRKGGSVAERKKKEPKVPSKRQLQLQKPYDMQRDIDKFRMEQEAVFPANGPRDEKLVEAFMLRWSGWIGMGTGIWAWYEKDSVQDMEAAVRTVRHKNDKIERGLKRWADMHPSPQKNKKKGQ